MRQLQLSYPNWPSIQTDSSLAIAILQRWSSWNAPEEAFTLAGEFFDQKSVDDGVLFGFHKMNQFLGLEHLDSKHFHDVEKNADVPKALRDYTTFLEHHFEEVLQD